MQPEEEMAYVIASFGAPTHCGANAMSTESSEFLVQWQDYRNHRIGYPKPPIFKEEFPTENDAVARKRQLQASGMVACVTPETKAKSPEW
jgi:hypothetical protein